MKFTTLGVPIAAIIALFWILPQPAASAQGPQPTPTIDRLAIPTLPTNPTQIDVGRSLYYYHCMPCHGDYGQGLTDEFRGIWEEDHQNCWGRGCHGGRARDEGFPIPTVIPAVNDPVRSEKLFPTEDELCAYLHSTHPPQNPGVLKDEEYQALAAYLFSLADRGGTIGQDQHKPLLFLALAGVGIVALAVIAIILPNGLARRRSERA